MPISAVIAFVAAGVFYTLGVIGYHCEGVGTWDALYRSLQFFTLGNDLENPSLILQVARFGAALVSGYAVISAIARILGHRFRLYAEELRTDHIVLLGAAPEIVPLAIGYQNESQKVAVIGDIGDEAAGELSSRGIPWWSNLSDSHLARVVAKTQTVVVAHATDTTTREQLARLRRLLPATQPYVLLDDAEWARRLLEDPGVTVRPICRSTQVARTTLKTCPALPFGEVVPDPLVIGDGPLADELARGIATTSQLDGWRPRVHRLLTDDSWLVDAHDDLGDDFAEAHQVSRLNACQAITVASDITKAWRPPQDGKGQAGGLRIYLAMSDESKAATIASALLNHDRACHVAFIVDQALTWEDFFYAHRDRLHLISATQVLGCPQAIRRGPADLLREELEIDTQLWAMENPALFNHSVPDHDGKTIEIDPKHETIEAVIMALARDNGAGCLAVLTQGGFSITPGAQLTPTEIVNPIELRAMAEELTTWVAPAFGDHSPHHDLTVWALELAARLPGIAKRSGWGIAPSNHAMLTTADIEELAPQVHQEYQRASTRMGNPTGSAAVETPWAEFSELMKGANRAVVQSYPIKLALAGLAWRRSEVPTLYEFSQDQISVLSVAEHRRWCHGALRDGRAGHHMILPWDALTQPVQNLDATNITTMPAILATAGIEIYEPAGRGEPCRS
ncbi:MAG: hypothetical protein ACK5LN_00930 [Propioniciclava sp.]